MVEIQPIGDHRVRLREHGRIRMGAKTEATAGKRASFDKLPNFRFTSTDREVLEELATLYGGTVEEWHDTRANPPDQFQLRSESARLEVYIIEGGLSIWYEQWSDGGLQRRCDGVTVSLDDTDGPCICRRVGALSCRPTTRIRVILPGITFGGVWRLESKGWNAMQELDATEQLLFGLTQSQIIRAFLGMEQRKKVVKGKTQHYVVPDLQPAVSIDRMLEGEGPVRALAQVENLSLPQPAPLPDAAAAPADVDLDGEEIVGEVVEDTEDPLGRPLIEAGVRVRTEHGTRNPLDDELMGLAAGLIAWSGSRYGIDDDAVLDRMTQERSKGVFRDWTLLEDDRKRKLIDFIKEVTANRCLPGEEAEM
jgi:hypothetical protein